VFKLLSQSITSWILIPRVSLIKHSANGGAGSWMPGCSIFSFLLPTLPLRAINTPALSSGYALVAAVTFRFLVLCAVATNEFGISLFKWLRWTIRETSFSVCQSVSTAHKCSSTNSLGAAFGGLIVAAT
jgi:hypothetical protein